MTSRTLKRSVIATVVATALVSAFSIGNGALWQAHAATTAPVIKTQAAGAATVPAAPVAPVSAAALAGYERNRGAQFDGGGESISVAGTVKNPGVPEFPQVDPDDPFYEFFRHFRVPQQRGERQVRGQGPGFILREDGIVLTNAHVIDGADEVTVKLTDKREFKAKVLGADKTTDVAVLKIDAGNLPTVKIGSSMNARVDE